MSAPAIPKEDLRALLRAIQTSQLLNRQLTVICQVNGLKGTGVKADLQNRIVSGRALSFAFKVATCLPRRFAC